MYMWLVIIYNTSRKKLNRTTYFDQIQCSYSALSLSLSLSLSLLRINFQSQKGRFCGGTKISYKRSHGTVRQETKGKPHPKLRATINLVGWKWLIWPLTFYH
jgi:hypothetical protein